MRGKILALLFGATIGAQALLSHQAAAQKLEPDPVQLQKALRNPELFFSDLINQVFRPSVSEIVTILLHCPECAVIADRYPSILIQEAELAALQAGAPEMIAFLEDLYPNGIYATLGRDAFYVADILEAFYLAMKIPDRVVRLGASTPTFSALNTDQRAYDFLVSNGFEMARALTGERPFAIIDRTGFSSGSQSTLLLRSIFQAAERGVHGKLATSVGVVSSSSGLADARGVTWREQISNVASFISHTPIPLPRPTHVPVMARFTDKTNLEWHGSFGIPMIQNPQGALSGTPGPVQSGHEWVIGTAWELYKRLSQPEFLERVRESARKRGINLEAQWGGSRARPRDRTKAMVNADLANAVGSDNSQIAQTLFERIQLQRVQGLHQSAHAYTPSQRAAVFNRHRRHMQAMRAELGTFTLFGQFFRELVFELPAVAQDESGQAELHKNPDKANRKAYFSKAGLLLSQAIIEWEQAQGWTAKDTASVITLVEWAIGNDALSVKDRRRLVLLALSAIPNLDSTVIEILKSSIDRAPLVRRTLMEHPKVFLTSGRYFNGRGRTIYTALLDAGVLPRTLACAEALTSEGED